MVGGKLFISGLMAAAAAVAAYGARAAEVCQGPPPARGVVIHGPVLDVPDGSSLCLAIGASPSAWIKVPLPRLQTTRSALMAAAFGKNATCVVGPNGAADCAIEGKPLAEALGQAGLLKAAWR
jgi:hypothetical protein